MVLNNQELQRRVAENHQEFVQLLSRAVQAGTSMTEDATLDLLADWLSGRGFEVVADRIDHELLTPEQRSRGAYNVIATRGTGKAPVVVNGHVDTVPAGDPAAWRHPPFSGRVGDGVIHGRGSVDTKGGIIATLAAIDALGTSIDQPLELHLVIGEETTSVGTLGAAASRPKPSAAIVLEPTGCRPVAAGYGSLRFLIDVGGVAAHASRPFDGVDAIGFAAEIRTLLLDHSAGRRAAERALDPDLPIGYTTIGRLSGGRDPVSVADRATLAGRIGMMPGESSVALHHELQNLLEDYGGAHPYLRAHPPRLTVTGRPFENWSTDTATSVAQAFRASCAAVGLPDALGQVAYASDADIYASLGVPTILFGPGHIASAHAVDESLDTRDLLTASTVLTHVLHRLLSAPNPV